DSNDPSALEDFAEENSDVWDDSALITAWDDAVKEYQSFHSIKSEKTPKVGSSEKQTKKKVVATSSEKQTKKVEATSSKDQTQKEGIKDSSIEEPDHTQNTYYNYGSDAYSAYGWYNNYYPPPPPPPQFYHHIPPPMDPNSYYRPSKPQTVVPPPMIDDEALSNLLMSWYYSGYYTGLFQVNNWRAF
ncbi:1605_t:CDS:2, partial [Scutellospora calospora]